ncbi:hypothetical protein COCSUDRAFT_55699 [Coccomyxa subellipsoidea C-169]|uniref:SGNH hydrolase-type esterase domain-containing protein n=1 Tax=Coccomyxa subellipsoidea (strain C-169) TaxID=574566 RepID=I0ZAP4_COCSC|nr:hypothetical protein COCSUDRAFT_55699 [Coccomyxa subellipsoidea C-169]EIE27713.1 hypothetical protein COCSUDRAFT_55699 [Coccomyxa subellipsoidea C-169]|eukprot:XP_005652257.1 hypothetical protein COCSUDRAFT_55699 [Coccomyxa subellipsoidea C-169]
MRRGFERLLRKLLRLRSEPALLVLHWWAPLYFQSSFWNVAEDELDVIASYYRVQSISFRDAFYVPIMADRPGFRLEDIFCDIVHPNAVGHRLFAELVVLQLQEVLAGLLLAPAATGGTWLQAMPPPLFLGNEAAGQAICLKGNALLSAVVSAKGEWKWVDEAREGAQQAKWGMLSTQAGDELLLRIDHNSPLPAQGDSGASSSSVVVGLGLLKSYKDVGAAAVGCSGGCSCNQTRFELLHDQQVSQVYWFYVFVTLSSQPTSAQDCYMSVTVESAIVPNGVNKVKVTSLMVSEDDRAENGNMFTVLKSTDAEGNNSG